ncbi:hypothetical protein [Mycolicibacterium houstonense]|uniref:hypothetical protein n=1 Tax=Mycolicibacterium houstonense TaxID=146021 RepID=UPI003F9AF994
MKFRVVGLIGVFALVAACGGGESAEHGPIKQTSAPPESAPSATLDQPAPEHGAVADTDPLKALADGVFMVTRDARATPAEIAGYQSLIATGDSLKTSTFIFADGSWRPKDVSQLIFSPSKGEWVESDRSFTVSAGPQGGSGWPTVESVGASGTGFYTLYRTDLSGAPLPDGLKRAMSEGAVLPESVTAATFSAGAVAFDMAHTAVDPEFTLDRIPQRNAAPKVRPVQACGTPSAECTTVATTLAEATGNGGQFTNASGIARIQLGPDGKGIFIMNVGATELHNPLKYTVTDSEGPARITFEAIDPAAEPDFRKAFGANIGEFAFYEYNGQVVTGDWQPAGKTTHDFFGFNRVAVNDILTKWAPARPAVVN